MDMDTIWSKLFSFSEVILKSVVIAVAGIFLIRLAMKILGRMLEKSKLDKAAHRLLKTVIKILLFGLLALMVASSLHLDVTGIVALASVLTLAISLALQDMLANVFGGFTLLNTRPFSSGDYVEIAGQAGTVAEINMSYTKLSTPDNKLISIPNSAVVAAQIVNYSAADTRRVDFNVSASYEAPVQKVIDALVLAGTEDNVLLNPAPFAAVTAYGDHAISYTLRVWVKNADYWDVYFKVNQKIKKIFDEQDISMTYPHLNVHIAQ